MAIHLAALSWALIFILRLRFPPGKSIAKVITCRLLVKDGARSTRKTEILHEKNIQILQIFYKFYHY